MTDRVQHINGNHQTISFTNTSAACATAFHDDTRWVRLVATKNCHVEFGDSPTATTSNMYLAPDVPEYFPIANPGSTKVAAIRHQGDSGGNGNLYITEFA